MGLKEVAKQDGKVLAKNQQLKLNLNPRQRTSLQQATMILAVGIAILMIVALLSHDRSDPGVFYRNATNLSGGCVNKIGCLGAFFADLLYGLVGYVAFAVPIILVAMGLTAFQARPTTKPPGAIPSNDLQNVLLIIGVIFTLVAGSGLAHLLFVPYPEGIGGGILGAFVGGGLQRTAFGFFGALLILLSLFLGGITVVTEISWLELMDKIGDTVMRLFEKAESVREKHGPAVANGSGAVLAASKEVLKSTRESAGKMSELLNRVSSIKDARPFARGNPLEQDVYGTRDPLFDSKNPEHDEARLSAAELGQATTTPANSLPAPVIETSAETANDIERVAEKTEAPAERRLIRAPKRKDGMISLPRVSILNPPPRERATQSKEALDSLATKIVESLGHYGVKDVQVVARDPGPVITRFELQLPDGTKASKVSGLANDLARNMCVSSVRVVEVIPGRPTIGIEVPNEKRDVVTISEMIESAVYKNSASPLTLALGKDIGGAPVVADLARMPHLLVAGTTGSGKSVAVNAMLLSLLYKATPEEVRLIMIDPKMLELSSYEHIPHLLAPVVTDMKDAANALRWCVAEMERRYLLMSKLKVRNISGYNQKVLEAEAQGNPILDPLFDPSKGLDLSPQALTTLPFIVIVVDEFADMMMVVGKKVEELIARLAQKARAAGIHLILATQRPSVDVITGLIKANIPTRIAFQVSTKIDSRTILDQGGAEQLLGYGDMLYMPPGLSLPQRIHGALVTDQEVEDVANYLKQQKEPDYIDGVLADVESFENAGAIDGAQADEEADPLYDESVRIVTESRTATISYLQRRLKVGYNRAARMIEAMEMAGVVSAPTVKGTREVLAPPPVEH